MKLMDAITNRDYSKLRPAMYNSFYNYYDQGFGDELGLTNLDYDVYHNMEKSGRLIVYAVREWIDSDTPVGLYLYILDEVPVCISYQNGRKNYPVWNFLNAEAFQQVRNFVLEHMRPKEQPYPGMDEDYLHLILDERLFNNDIIPVHLYKSPLVDWKFFLTDEMVQKNIESIERGIPTEKYVLQYIQDVVVSHNKFRDALVRENSPELTRYDESAKGLYEKAISILTMNGIVIN